MKKRIMLFCLVMCLFTIPSCSPKSQEPKVFHGVITFISGNLAINNQDALVGSRVQKGDVLSTGDNSLAVMQLGQTAVITLRSNTELKMDNLVINKDESQIVTQSLTNGSTFHKVIKKGTVYSVKTPAIVASVRGTAFEVSVKDSKNRVSILDGKVHTALTTQEGNIQAQEVELAAGRYIEVDGKAGMKPADLDKKEMESLARLDAIAAVPDVEKAFPVMNETSGKEKCPTPEIEVVPEAVKGSILNDEDGKKTDSKKRQVKKDEFIPSPKAVKELMKKEDRTLADIKCVFKRIDEISLFNGRIVKGAISERGSKYSVITTDGVVKISEQDIRTIRVIR